MRTRAWRWTLMWFFRLLGFAGALNMFYTGLHPAASLGWCSTLITNLAGAHLSFVLAAENKRLLQDP